MEVRIAAQITQIRSKTNGLIGRFVSLDDKYKHIKLCLSLAMYSHDLVEDADY